MEEIKSLPLDGQVRKRTYCCLALLQNHYSFAWQNQGAMAELHKYSEIAMKVLEENSEDQEELSIVAIATLLDVQALTMHFISGDITYEQIYLRYLLKQMTPSARRALEKASQDHKKSDTSDGMTQISRPSKDDAKQDGDLTLHNLTRALTQTFDSETLVTENLIQLGVETAQESKDIISSTAKSRDSSNPDDGFAECGTLHTRNHDPLLTKRKPEYETLPRPISAAVDEQTNEKENTIDATSSSTREPTTDSLSFVPRYLSDVFLSVTPPIRVQYLLSILNLLIKVYYNYHRLAEADLLTIYSALPVDSPEQPDYAPLQVSQLIIEASRLAATEDLDGMLSVFQKSISIHDSSALVWYVSLDYIIIMNKLGRPMETDRVINQIFYGKRIAHPIDPIKLERDIARVLQNVYI